MSQNNEQNTERLEEETVARVLQLVGRGELLPDSTNSVWRDEFKSELDAIVTRRRQKRRKLLGLFTASAATIMAGFIFFAAPRNPSLNTDTHVRISMGSGHIRVDGEILSRNEFHSGKYLELGTRVETGYDSLLAIEYGKVKLRLNQRTRIRLFSDKVELTEGQIYAASDGTVEDGSSITIDTPLGDVSDIGTQFTVGVNSAALVSIVRDGSIKIETDSGTYTAVAGPEYAQQVKVSAAKKVEISQAERHGRQWDWVLSLADTFDIEGRSAFDFLYWAATETGRRLVFADKRTELNARSTILHGDISSLGPNEAIEVVLATTNLKVSQQDANTLRVLIAHSQ